MVSLQLIPCLPNLFLAFQFECTCMPSTHGLSFWVVQLSHVLLAYMSKIYLTVMGWVVEILLSFDNTDFSLVCAQTFQDINRYLMLHPNSENSENIQHSS